ncbi:SusC/RagA family TonB-linked outer membrane protein [Pseudoflavitalea rhizosphaerae]|uniref:SusC/RagA family TonB-linked outer membrane protein n=1 Tax=Pseudoflavitalea rhizosphaerae TaxID=1884793 RepID=UPI000F8EC73D|nr:SusC/RagA family TonB-linked outer membrane protein [Pseudoflavitalea rhizosphaerae]
MKRSITALILVIGCLFCSLRGTTQVVTLSVKNAKLESVLKQIKNQTGYSFFFNEVFYSKASKVTLNIKGVTLSEALTKIFSQQSELVYTIVGSTVVVTEKEKPELPLDSTGKPAVSPAGSATGSVKGFVYNKRYEPLSNASIMLRGTSKGVSTAANGSFEMKDAKLGDILRVSYIGYKPMDVKVEFTQGTTVILEDATNELDQVVAQGYSKTTRLLSTSSVARVSGEEIARQPVMNPLMALQGKVPGMVVTPNSGHAAAPVEITIRGKSLLSASSPNPLIVVDGTPMNVGSNDGVLYGDGPVQGWMATLSPAGSQSQLFGFNPKDIESIEVLKDLGSTAIYGSSGANGVILITTKRAKSNTSDLNVNIGYGLSKVMRYFDMLNTQQYLEMRREAFRNDGITPTPADAPDLLLWDTTRYTDWQKEIFGNTGSSLNAMISYSGGGPQLRTTLSASYSTVRPITRVAGKNESINVRVATDFASNNQKFKVAATATYTYTVANMVSTPILSKLPPNAPPLLDSAGEINFKGYEGTIGVIESTSIQNLFKPIDSRTNGLMTNFRISYQLAKGLSLISNLGYGRSNNESWALTPIRSQNPAMNPTGQTVHSRGTNSTFTFEPQLSYDTWIGKGKLAILTGATFKNEKRESLSTMAIGFTNDALLRSILSAPFSYTGNTYSPYKYFGVLGRVEYIWDNKYVVNLTGRRDGSSRFGPGNRFGNFGSVGAAWIATAEPWIAKTLAPVVSMLKFNANYGTAGSDGGSDYQYLTQWGKKEMPVYGGVAPMVSMHAVNQDYHWQSSKEINVGMDMGFGKDSRVSLSLNYYSRRTGDQLLNNPTPIYTGFPTVYGNWNAVIENKGYEAAAVVRVIDKKDFSWTMTMNGGINKNTLVSYPGIENSPDFYKYVVGKSVQNVYLLNYVGVDPMTGNYQFQDYNKDGFIDPSSHFNLPPLTFPSDVQKVLLLGPKFTGGINQSLRYKNLSLNLSFSYRFQNGMEAFRTAQNPGTMGNITVEMFNNRWRKPGDNSKYSKFTTTYNQSYARELSNLGYVDASNLRMNNITLSWSLTEKIYRKLGLKGAFVSINAQNIFVITNYQGLDPDIQSINVMPPTKEIVLNINITL